MKTKIKYEKFISLQKNEGLTHAYGHWLVDLQLKGFAPAFTLSFRDSECSRKLPTAHSFCIVGRNTENPSSHRIILRLTL